MINNPISKQSLFVTYRLLDDDIAKLRTSKSRVGWRPDATAPHSKTLTCLTEQ